MKHEHQEDWHTLNRRCHQDYDPVFYWSSWIVGILIVLFITVTVIYQLKIIKHIRKPHEITRSVYQ